RREASTPRGRERGEGRASGRASEPRCTWPGATGARRGGFGPRGCPLLARAAGRRGGGGAAVSDPGAAPSSRGPRDGAAGARRRSWTRPRCGRGTRRAGAGEDLIHLDFIRTSVQGVWTVSGHSGHFRPDVPETP